MAVALTLRQRSFGVSAKPFFGRSADGLALEKLDFLLYIGGQLINFAMEFSKIGRTLNLQAGGRVFESRTAHHPSLR